MGHSVWRRRRNLIQNIAIALLSLSAVLLFAQLQLYNLDTREDSRYLDRLMGTLPADTPTELREFPAPVRVVLTDSYGRYGSLGFTTNSDGFAALGLREALSSVQSLVPVSEDSFRAALSGVSIYFDFLDPLPLSVLTEMIGVEDAALTGSARCLLLSAGADETVWLYLWDGADSVRSGTVSASVLSREALAETVSQSGYSGVSFAFDDVEADPLYSQLFPLSVLPTELPELPVLSAVSPLSETDWLLPAFGFNVNTRERYVEVDSKETAIWDSKWQDGADAEAWPAYEIYPDSPWNYALVLDADDPLKHLNVVKRSWPADDFPFTQAAAPVVIEAKGRRVPGWGIDEYGLADVLPDESAVKSPQVESILLVPMGSARLRISAFPVAE